ncbi:protein phosphatase 1 regulatory subunit 15 isoform X2 [Colletes latitarsis]
MQHLPLKLTMEKMFSMNNSTLSMENNMSSPKKENMLHSVFNAFNTIWERFSKVSGSFMASINHPLSVTVVHNEGIISHEFFKNLTTKRDMLNTDNVYIQGTQIKESLNVIESIHHDIFDEKKPYESRISNENIKEKLNYNYKCNENKNNDVERSDKNESVITQKSKSNSIDCNYLLPTEESNEMLADTCLYINTNKLLVGNNFHNYANICNEDTFTNKQVSHCINDNVNEKPAEEESFSSTSSSSIVCVESNKQITVSNMLTDMWHKVCDSVTDRFYKTDLIESDISMKGSHSPKQRRKLNTITKGRGRGRARSQLRRSGVSQTRHRKERTKHDLEVDIENDFKSWQEFEMYHTIGNKELEDCFRLDEDMIDTVDTNSSMSYTFADVEPKVQKPKIYKMVDQDKSKFSTKMRCMPECREGINAFHEDCVENRYNSQRKTFRPRLMSESSINSEDSYCIVFETESEVTYRSDLEDSDESDMDETSEDEDKCKDKESGFPVQKVKFNLKPIVHTMVHWDYAYRAARRGPWEEMARDRERFKGRINCIERVLNPILSNQHRTHIWQERFAITE